MPRRFPLVAVAAAVIGSAAIAVAAAARRYGTPALVFVGNQAGDIHAVMLDRGSGDLASLGPVAAIERPTWLLSDRGRGRLYAVSEVGNKGDRPGEVASFAVDPARRTLCELARVTSGGGGATHLALDPAGSTLFVANFGGGQAASIAVARSGALSAARPGPQHIGSGPHRRQQGPHPHGVTLSPKGDFLVVPDMGTDEIRVHAVNAAGHLSPVGANAVRTPAGAGPRLALFGRDGRYVYVLSELSAEIFVFAWDAVEGRLGIVGRVALDEGDVAEGRSAAGFAMSADGRTLYASNRRTDTIHVFAVDCRTGLVRETQRVPAGGGKPWALELDPTGRWLLVAAQASDLVLAFRVDRRSGRLARAGAAATIPTPTGFAFA